jgi:hypothetical protein
MMERRALYVAGAAALAGFAAGASARGAEAQTATPTPPGGPLPETRCSAFVRLSSAASEPSWARITALRVVTDAPLGGGGYGIAVGDTSAFSEFSASQLLAACEAAHGTPAPPTAIPTATRPGRAPTPTGVPPAPTATPVPGGAPPVRCGLVQAAAGGQWYAAAAVVMVRPSGAGSYVTLTSGGNVNSTYSVDQVLTTLCAAGA